MGIRSYHPYQVECGASSDILLVGTRPLLHGGGSIPTLLGLSLNLRIYITGEETREGDIDLLF